MEKNTALRMSGEYCMRIGGGFFPGAGGAVLAPGRRYLVRMGDGAFEVLKSFTR